MIIRGRVLHFLRKPNQVNLEGAYEYFEEGALVIDSDRILEIGEYAEMVSKYPDCEVEDHKENLIFPGFIDLHNHFPQVQVIGSYGTQLLEWLNKYTFPEEARFSDKVYAKEQAKKLFFLTFGGRY